MANTATGLSVVLLGTYDLGKPRTRLMRTCLRQIDPHLREVHVDVWSGVEDKSVSSILARLVVLAKLVLAYPLLAVRYLFAGRHDVVVVGYLGLFDMLLLAPLVKIRGKPVVWDAFLSIYDTYIRDRGMGAEGGVKAGLLRWAERTACRLADQVVLDTHAHAALMAELHEVPEQKLGVVLVGAEEDVFVLPDVPRSHNETVEVLFYGQFIPLHGIDTIVDAALDPRGQQFNWTIIGQGQEAPRIDARLAAADAPHVNRTFWVDYEELSTQMAHADICLGIFGTSDKAARVIPNKVYQAFFSYKPVLTRASPAIEELIQGETRGVYLVPPGDPQALLDALEQFARDRDTLPEKLHEAIRETFALPSLIEQWRAVLGKAAK